MATDPQTTRELRRHREDLELLVQSCRDLHAATKELQVAAAHNEEEHRQLRLETETLRRRYDAELAESRRKFDEEQRERLVAMEAERRAREEAFAKERRVRDEAMAQERRVRDEAMAQERQARDEAMAKERQAREEAFEISRRETQELSRETDRKLAELRASIQDMRKELGALGLDLGGFLEDLGAYAIPIFLEQELGVRVESLTGEYVEAEGREIEVDLIGPGKRGEEELLIVAEVKARFHVREVERFARNAEAIARARGKVVLPVIFGFRLHPRARALARDLGIVVVPWEYQDRL